MVVRANGDTTRETSPAEEDPMCQQADGRCRDRHNLTRHALDHRLQLRLGIIRSCTATEQAPKVLSILIRAVCLLGVLVQGA